MKTTKIYALIDPRTGEIRYVGKTNKRLTTRLSEHLSEDHVCHKTHWIQSLGRTGITPEIHLVQEVPGDHWAEAERYWINYFRSIGCALTNMTDGGEGTYGKVVSVETRAKMSAARANYVCTDETRAKISAALKGKPRPEGATAAACAANRGAKRSEESKALLRAAWAERKAVGYVVSEETRAKRSATMTEKGQTEEYRQKLRDAQARANTPKARAAKSAGQQKRRAAETAEQRMVRANQSEDVKARKSEAQKARRAREAEARFAKLEKP